MSMLEYSNVNGVVRLEIALAPDQAIDTVTWGMLSHNQIPGVARTSRTQLDDRVALVFEVVGERLAQYMEKPRRKDEVVALLDALVKTLVEAERYMIPLESFVLNADDVFIDPETGAVSVVCLPLLGGPPSDALMFFKQVVFNLRYDERDDSAYVSDLIGVLGGAATLDLARLARVLRTIDLAGAAGPAHTAMPYGVTPGAPTASDVPVTGDAYALAPGGYGAAPEVVPSRATGVQTGAHGAPVAGAPRPGAAVGPAAGPGFAVPRTSGPPVPASVAKRREQPKPGGHELPSEEKEISLLYLLQHYSAENKAAYDRQRKAKAGRKAADNTDRPVAAPVPPSSAGAGAPADASTVHPPAHPIDTGESFGHTVNLAAVSVYKTQAADRGPAAGASASGAPSSYESPADYSLPPTGYPLPPAGYPQHARAAEQPAVRPGPPAGTALRGTLRRVGSGEVVRIDKPVFVIGRRRTRVDCALTGETVSKKHAIVHTGADGFSIIDNSSTNGVEIDGQRIAPLERIRLVPGVRIGIGDEELIFDVEA